MAEYENNSMETIDDEIEVIETIDDEIESLECYIYACNHVNYYELVYDPYDKEYYEFCEQRLKELKGEL